MTFEAKVFQHSRRSSSQSRASSSTTSTVILVLVRRAASSRLRECSIVPEPIIGCWQPEFGARCPASRLRSSSRNAPLSCTAKPWTVDRPRPVPLPSSLVVKNGSVALRRISASMPLTGVANDAGARTAPLEFGIARDLQLIGGDPTEAPPSGMASRALTTRFSTASSI